MTEQQTQTNAIEEMVEMSPAVETARVNITWAGQNGDLPDPVNFGAAPEQIKQWATEAVRNGDIPGIPADASASFEDFVVDRFEPTAARPFPLIQLRPKTAFGLRA